MEDAERAVVFSVDARRFAVSAACVDFVTRAVALTPLPNAPDIVAGLVNVRGVIMPVVSVRRRSGIPDRPLSSGDYFIVARTPRRSLALIADAILGLFPFRAEDFSATAEVLRGVPHLGGILQDPDGLILIHDLERFLSLEEEQFLDVALAGHTS
ncbi:MAG: purine-binding chemotaxis protein CheW [Candidatus Hydrogenedentes bacterium]|nr:purine-binding chemotaxis protein CheW [Candidatus Hydrogenedentota bacterium]